MPLDATEDQSDRLLGNESSPADGVLKTSQKQLKGRLSMPTYLVILMAMLNVFLILAIRSSESGVYDGRSAYG